MLLDTTTPCKAPTKCARPAIRDPFWSPPPTNPLVLTLDNRNLCLHLNTVTSLPQFVWDIPNLESTLRIRRPKHWSYSFSNSPSKENSGLIFFRMDWLDLFAVQGTLKSLLQHHGFKSIISEWWGLEKDISTGRSFQRILQDHVPYIWPTPKGL